MSIHTPNAYWALLGDKHERLLAQHGFDVFKRTVNWHFYQIGVESRRDPHLWFLLRHFAWRPWRLSRAFQARLDGADARPLRWPKPLRRPWLYAFYVGLVWQRALELDHLGLLDHVQEPLVGSPVPVFYQGRLITQDLAACAMELNWIARYIGPDLGPHVVEIGAGYGRVAWLALTAFPRVNYQIVDIEPAARIAAQYLRATVGDNDRWSVWCPEVAMERVTSRSIDLVINVSSFDEMHPNQVEAYFAWIDRVCRGWFYLKAHRKGIPLTPTVTGSIVGGLESMPVRRNWRCVAEAPDPVQPNFAQRLYWVGTGP